MTLLEFSCETDTTLADSLPGIFQKWLPVPKDVDSVLAELRMGPGCIAYS